jgi:DNA-binding response OmpR family regulator
VVLESPDLLVLGPRLPDMAPIELVKVLRQRYLDVPVLLLVEGADAVATAPVVAPEFLECVNQLLERERP